VPLKFNPTLIRQPIQDQWILLDTERELYLQLNASGIAISEWLCERDDVDAVADRLCARYAIDFPRARDDVRALRTELLARRILVEAV
jgi:hypothetical protein